MGDSVIHVVAYHANCSDGFTAAWAARRGLMKQGVEVCCVPLTHTDDLTVKLSGWGVGNPLTFVDFCPKPDDLFWLGNTFGRVEILDHHVSAMKSLEGKTLPLNVTVLFDMNRSGARIAWERFNDEPAPDLVRYIEDHDLWRFALPNAKEILTVLHSAAHSFEKWDEFLAMGSLEPLAVVGKALLEFQESLVERASRDAVTVEISGWRVPGVNGSLFRSELGNRLAKGAPFSCVWYQYEPGKVGVSLRSIAGQIGAVDVSEVAKLYGGGGHKNAAGFTLSAPPLVVGSYP